MMLKIIGYLFYVMIFTYCYYFLNRKLKTRWILIGYPLFFVASIYPVKLWFDYIRQIYSVAFADTWLKIILMSLAGFTLFNFVYGIVNLMINTQVNFHQKYGKPHLNPVRFITENASSIKGGYHLFFYIGGVWLIAIAFWKY